MIEETVLSTDKKIGNSIAIKVAGARTGGMASQFLVGKIALPREAPAAIFSTHLPPKDDIPRVHDKVWLAVTVPVGKAELAASA